MNVVISANENNINPIITVHDCFGTHPNNLQALSHLVKIEFIKIYTNSNFLEKFHLRNKLNILDNGFKIKIDDETKNEYVLLKRTKHYIPNIPKIGDLDLHKIIDSKYMIT
jgi:DNA-directed RNA polymerase